MNYYETLVSVAKMKMVRILLSLVVHFGWEIQQYDVKNVFLQGDLEEEVYMEPPPGFDDKYGPNKVCRLKKTLYGLKQFPWVWFGKLTKAMMKFV